MTILVHLSPESLTSQRYEEAQRRLVETGHWLPDGLEYHVCFGAEGNLRVSEIWSSKEQCEDFCQHLFPIHKAVGIRLSSPPEFLEIYNKERS